MFHFLTHALADLRVRNKCPISAGVDYDCMGGVLHYGAVLATETTVVDDNVAVWASTNESVGVRKGVGRQGLGVVERNKAAPALRCHYYL